MYQRKVDQKKRRNTTFQVKEDEKQKIGAEIKRHESALINSELIDQDLSKNSAR